MLNFLKFSQYLKNEKGFRVGDVECIQRAQNPTQQKAGRII